MAAFDGSGRTPSLLRNVRPRLARRVSSLHRRADEPLDHLGLLHGLLGVAERATEDVG